ncbi:hypothetical protein ACTA71_006026 [Dictyostelium dimigraforme]
MFENIKSLIFSTVSLLLSFLYYHSDSIISLFSQNLSEAVLETIDEHVKPKIIKIAMYMQTIIKQSKSIDEDLVQGTKKWEKAREKYSLTGSRLAAAIGIDPYTTQHDLKLILAKKKTPFFSDYCKRAMEHGKKQEPIARDLYFYESGAVIIERGIFPLPDDQRIGCSPDGVIYTEVPGKDGVLKREGVIEIKCPLSATNFCGLKNGRKPDALINARKYHWIIYHKYLQIWHVPVQNAISFIDTPLNEIPLRNEKTLIINTLLLQKLKVLNSHLNIHVRTKYSQRKKSFKNKK